MGKGGTKQKLKYFLDIPIFVKIEHSLKASTVVATHRKFGKS